MQSRFNNLNNLRLENIIHGKEKNARNQHFFLFPQCFLPSQNNFQFLSHIYFVICKCFNSGKEIKISGLLYLNDYEISNQMHSSGTVNPFPNEKFWTPSKLKEFADDNFRFDENGIKFFNWLENTEKRRNCSLRAISRFLTVFSKDLYCRHVKTRACLGKS